MSWMGNGFLLADNGAVLGAVAALALWVGDIAPSVCYRPFLFINLKNKYYMKKPSLGDYLLWNGKPAKIIGETDRRQVIIELLENCKCPHCQGDLGKEQIHMIVSSPLFQQSAERLPTIQDDDSLIVS